MDFAYAYTCPNFSFILFMQVGVDPEIKLEKAPTIFYEFIF